MRLYITEKLEKLDADVVANVDVLRDPDVQRVLAFSFNPVHKFKLPSGAPVTRTFNTNKLGSSIIEIATQFPKFIYFTDDSKIKDEGKRWLKFTEMFEGLCPEEQALLLAMKDQSLTDLYPNITTEFLKQHGFPL